MTLEDIPEIQLMDDPFEHIDLTKKINYNGKFITIACPDGKNRIFSIHDYDSHLFVNEIFHSTASSKYKVNGIKSETTGGGRLAINSEKVIISESSRRYGKYSPEVVLPIIERFVRQHLPNHTIELK